jgi:hypothetical protein
MDVFKNMAKKCGATVKDVLDTGRIASSTPSRSSLKSLKVLHEKAFCPLARDSTSICLFLFQTRSLCTASKATSKASPISRMNWKQRMDRQDLQACLEIARRAIRPNHLTRVPWCAAQEHDDVGNATG